MRFGTLAEWLAWQETVHPVEMDLGLARVRVVHEALRRAGAPPFLLVTVAGTNGKGSTAAFAQALLTAAGVRTGTYTSPHLVAYNERIRIDGQPAPDDAIMAAFDRIDRARGGVTLTYFEFGTLAAVEVFRASAVEAAVLEVGIGGRLDAVNLFDPDVAVVTPIDIDHVRWLGSPAVTKGTRAARPSSRSARKRASRRLIRAGPRSPGARRRWGCPCRRARTG